METSVEATPRGEWRGDYRSAIHQCQGPVFLREGSPLGSARWTSSESKYRPGVGGSSQGILIDQSTAQVLATIRASKLSRQLSVPRKSFKTQSPQVVGMGSQMGHGFVSCRECSKPRAAVVPKL